MSKLTAEKFLDYVERSGLADKDRLAEALSALKKSDPQAWDDSERMASRLIEAKLLTRWQCDNLLQGKYKAFKLGQYKLMGLLGSGGMSSVYLAEHTMMHCLRAIKVLPEKRVEDSSYLDRFRREAIAAGRLNHPNIVQTLDIGQEGKWHFIVMEYVEGRDLQSLVKEQGALDYDLAANYIQQAAEGLHYAHQAHLIHRDVKPANLLVDPRGVVKLLDLGLARFTDDTKASLTVDHDENVLGTADYLAPEQASDSHSADHRADIYSLGCTLYFLLTGHPPFPTGTLPQRIYMHQAKAPASVYEDRADAPQPLVDICTKMMQKSPDARYQTAREVAVALAGWLTARRTGSSGDLGVGGSANFGGGSLGGSGNFPIAPPRRTATAPLPPPRREKPDTTSDTLADTERETIKGPSRPRPTRPAAGQPVGQGSSDSSVRAKQRKPGESGRTHTPPSGLPRAHSLTPVDDPGDVPRRRRDWIGLPAQRLPGTCWTIA